MITYFRRGGVLAALLLLAFVPAVVAEEWKETRSKEGRFKVKFPGDPVKQQQQVPTQLGNLTMHTFAVETDGGSQAFMVMYNDYPADQIKNSNTDDLLKACKGGVLSSSNGKVKKDRNITLSGNPGMEFTFSGDSGGRPIECAWRIFLVKNRLYQVAILRFNNAPAEDDVKKFFESFAFTD
jgi:hypothetical protein